MKTDNVRVDQADALDTKASLVLRSSASFLAELSVSSPRKLLIFIISKNIFWIKVSKKIFNLIFKKEALLRR